MPDARLIGVISRSEGTPHLGYINAEVAVSPELLDAVAPARPLTVLRIAARCQESQCQHFDGSECSLARRIVETLPEVSSSLPPCAVRRSCRWYAEQAGQACRRCAQIVTEVAPSTVDARLVGHPGGEGAPDEAANGRP